jgi:DNA-directed RNA polymerase specialized sigma24 family protein
VGWRVALAQARFEGEYNRLRGRLARLARFKYRLAWEDCEELAADALHAWQQELSRQGALENDGAYLKRVLRNGALDRKKALARLKRDGQTVPLDDGDEDRALASDLEIDRQVAEREELRHLGELVKEVLSDRERGVMALSKLGLKRAQIGERHGLTVRQVERCLERAQRKLDTAVDLMSEMGRCRMLALVIANIKAGRVGPEHPRYTDGMAHLEACWRCRARVPIDQSEAA